MNENYDITTAEEELRGVLREMNLSTNVFLNRPRAIADFVTNFVVVKITGEIEDRAAYGVCTVSISLFAKDVEEKKNDKKLSHMYKKLVQHMPATVGNTILITTKPTILGDTPDTFGFHSRVILFNRTIIKAV